MNTNALSRVFIILTFFFSACNSGKQNETSAEVEEPVEEITVQPTGETVEILLLATDQMQFDQQTIKVKEGQTVRLTLQHSGRMPKAAMGHNFVLLKKGVSLSEFGQKAAGAAGNDYIPHSEKRNIIAHTKMIGGGESDTIEFLTPPRGEYEFLCSFPGHYAIMKGIFVVE